jgi:inosose dehydratase
LNFRIGNAPTSWGIEKELATDRPEWPTFLDEVRDCGYEGVELGPLGYLPTDPAVLTRELAMRGLQLTAGYVMGPLHDQRGADELIAEAKEVVELIAAAGARFLVVLPGISEERAATAGRSDAARRLGEAGLSCELAAVREIATTAAARGIRAVLHPHAGTYVEFSDEIERVLGAIEAELLGLVVDTGHCVYGGLDPVAAIESHADRLCYVHLKDVNPAVLERCREQGLSFWEAYRLGVFCVLGTGANDFAAIKSALESVGYQDWLTVEQDADPSGSSDPRKDAVASLTLLRRLGFTS